MTEILEHYCKSNRKSFECVNIISRVSTIKYLRLHINGHLKWNVQLTIHATKLEKQYTSSKKYYFS